jgi:hypothetical protein
MLWLATSCPYAGNAAKMPNPFAAPREKFKSFGMYLQNCRCRDLIGVKALRARLAETVAGKALHDSGWERGPVSRQ